MAARCLTRHVANHVTMSHLMSAVGCNVQLHTASTCLDSPEFQKRNAPGGSNIGALKTATPAATQHYHNGGTGGEVPQAEVLGRDLRHGLPARARTPMASAQGQQAQQQRRSLSDDAPRTGTQREHQSRGDFADRRGSRDRAARGAQDWRPTSNLLDVQSQRPSTTQGSSNFRGQPKVTGPAAGSRPAFIDRSGPRPAFVDRSQPGRGPRPAFIDRSGAAHRKDMPDQRQRSAWQTHQQGSQSQQGRPAPSNMRMPLPDVPDDDDSEQQAFDEPTRRTRARKAAPSSSFRTERTAPGSRAGGPARGAQANIPAAFDDDMDSELDREQQEGVSENFLERMQYNSRGVPASWKDTIQDAEVRHHALH